MAGVFTDIRNLYAKSSIVSRYVLWNSGMMLATIIASFVLFLMHKGDTSVIEHLGLYWKLSEWKKSPLGLITGLFTHAGLMHFLGNMLSLYFGGLILLRYASRENFIKAYWLGGLTGCFLFLLVYNLFPEFGTSRTFLVGASGAVFAIWTTLGAKVPDEVVHLTLIGPAKIKYIVLVMIILNLPLSLANVGGDLAHLGGVIFGYYYGRNLAVNNDPFPVFDSWHQSILDRLSGRRRPKKAKMTIVKDGNYSRDDHTYNEQKKAAQDVVDAILDKVGRSGYDSLSKKEKAILDQYSKGS